MNYTKRFDWEAVDEVKGWEHQNQRDDLHKVTVVEYETGNNNRQTFNFTPAQTSSDRWIKHVDQWIERLNTSERSSVLS